MKKRWLGYASLWTAVSASTGCVSTEGFHVKEVGSFHAGGAQVGKVKGIVAVEPGGAPDPARIDLSASKNVPHLFVWGDNLAGNDGWTKLRAAPDRYRAALLAQGVKADLLDLPARGIRGNSHMLMMDRNSDEVASLIQSWMAANGLMKP